MTPIMLTGPPPAAVSISPTVLFTRSGDKRDFFHVFLLPLSQYPFNVKNNTKISNTQPHDLLLCSKVKVVLVLPGKNHLHIIY